jgi:HD superfamily phosphohydrolase
MRSVMKIVDQVYSDRNLQIQNLLLDNSFKRIKTEKALAQKRAAESARKLFREDETNLRDILEDSFFFNETFIAFLNGVNPKSKKERTIFLEAAKEVNKKAADFYKFVEDFCNVSDFPHNIKSVKIYTKTVNVVILLNISSIACVSLGDSNVWHTCKSKLVGPVKREE